MTKKKDAVLLFMPAWAGFHLGAWRSEDSPHDAPMNFDAIRRMVETAERGKFHGFFVPDVLCLRPFSRSAMCRTALGSRFEPITLMSAMTAYTKHMGLLCTASTTYNEPYHVARMFASLDHISGGRAGWNVVTGGTDGESVNFGREQHLDHATRYSRGEEFFEIVTGLWDSWEDDAFIVDRKSGIYFDPDKLHQLDYRGEHLSVAGPLNIARPVQGHPVIAQAGSSAPGRAFAARNADVVYTLQSDLEKAKDYYDDIKQQAAEFGRDPDHVKVLPALILVIGGSQAEADEKLARLDAQLDPEVGLEQLSEWIQTDLSSLPLDGPVPEVPKTELSSVTRQKYFLDVAKRDNLTVRQLMQVAARLGTVASTPTAIADHIQEWVEAGAADGLNITMSDAGDSLDLFVDEVIPRLQRRGIFHTDYRGTTLRQNLGIPRPANRFARSLQ